MIASGGLLGFGAVADGSLADYDGIYAASVDEIVAASDAASALAVFATTFTDTGSASDTPVASQLFASFLADISSISDSPAGFFVFADAVADVIYAATMQTPQYALASSLAETIAAIDGNFPSFTFDVTIAETGLDSIYDIPGGLLGFGSIGSGALGAGDSEYIGFRLNDGVLASVSQFPSLTEAASIADSSQGVNSISVQSDDVLNAVVSIQSTWFASAAFHDQLTIAHTSIGWSPARSNYIDPEIICVRYEPRFMRVQEVWKISMAPERRNSGAAPDYEPSAEPRKRTC